MFHNLTYIEKREIVQKLHTDRAILILQKPKLTKKSSKKTVKRQKKQIKIASPELEKAFLLM